jgi:predicted  nucleic acid-binding Zn-ribbon protein
MDLKQALLKISKELESQNAMDIASLKHKLSRVEEKLTGEKKRNDDLDVENQKLKGEISHLKAKSDSDDSTIAALRSELQRSVTKLQATQIELQETQEKLVEAYQDMDTTVDDSYRDCVKTL